MHIARGALVGLVHDPLQRGTVVDSHPDLGWRIWWSALEEASWHAAVSLVLHEAWSPSDPARTASIEEERLGLGWVQEITGSDDCRPNDANPPEGTDMRPVPGPPGKWALVSATGVPQSYHHQRCVASVWSRWLIPSEVTP